MWGHHHHHGMWDNYDMMDHMIYDHHHHHGMYGMYGEYAYHYPAILSTTVPGHVMTSPQVIYIQQPMATYQTVPQQVIMAQPSQTVIAQPSQMVVAQPVAQFVPPTVSQTSAQEADRQGIMKPADTVYAPVVSSRDIQASVQQPTVVVGPRVVRKKKPTCCC